MKTERAYEKLLRYVKYFTTSDEESSTVPSTKRQFDLGYVLADELTKIGCENVRIDDKCYIYAKIPATKGYEKASKIGFISHIDTAPDFCGENVNPRIIENYDGGDVVLSDSGRTLTCDKFPELPGLAGKTLIVTDGKTLLGADDKAGVAEIMTMAQNLICSDIPHGEVLIAFTPDEEIGMGAFNFDVRNFGADFAYTVDGGKEGGLEFENFNAAAAKFTVKGFSVHPGEAKNKMINAGLVAMEINSMLPSGDVPAKTEGYEGFYHLTDIKGDMGSAEISYIVRDHSATVFDARIATLKHIEKVLNEKYPAGTVTLEIKPQYRNMAEIIANNMHLVENAKLAAERCGVIPTVEPIRGGTDGATLSYMGLPCPNLGTGGYAFHGPYEHICAEDMDKEVEILTEIVKIYAEK